MKKIKKVLLVFVTILGFSFSAFGSNEQAHAGCYGQYADGKTGAIVDC
ncbi:hypothetical protein [Macrococcus armenti]|nr:hypothetical protein [Macrococcus armenti]UBH16668.1 hypothetical protein LAU44_12375 [Macrococcus armenti]UBH18938.1 hypothetical protein LAU39_11930 [Macrococcus armenti]UBH21301.1 hypothetical protein LAU40_12410 [Macrococcus armenti]